jgi:hypothetical protein
MSWSFEQRCDRQPDGRTIRPYPRPNGSATGACSYYDQKCKSAARVDLGHDLAFAR